MMEYLCRGSNKLSHWDSADLDVIKL